jgi:hypothetical protein
MMFIELRLKRNTCSKAVTKRDKADSHRRGAEYTEI